MMRWWAGYSERHCFICIGSGPHLVLMLLSGKLWDDNKTDWYNQSSLPEYSWSLNVFVDVSEAMLLVCRAQQSISISYLTTVYLCTDLFMALFSAPEGIFSTGLLLIRWDNHPPIICAGVNQPPETNTNR